MNTLNRFMTKVVVCPKCKGAGEILKDPGYRSNTYDIIECSTCKGSGRLIRKVTVEFTPYGKDAILMVRV